MPKLPKAKVRSWIKSKPQQSRQFDNSEFYHSTQWRSVRKYFIKQNPLCATCFRDGLTTEANVVDHIKPITLGGHKTDLSNLQSLCNSCHNKKSAKEGVEYRKGIKEYKRN